MDNERIMRRALELACLSYNEWETPVGCVITKDKEIVGEGRNRRETSKNALAHAEIEAINDACRNLGGWRLWQCELFVTLEPCPMCAGAIINSRIIKVYFSAYDKKNGACGSVTNLFEIGFTHQPLLEGGLLEEESSDMLRRFFMDLRTYKANHKALFQNSVDKTL
ncbi:MAG: nucleoside deaminase [Clostridiales bacterium]|nr:nucleoside deaminase [Clostridiales bacterium]